MVHWARSTAMGVAGAMLAACAAAPSSPWRNSEDGWVRAAMPWPGDEQPQPGAPGGLGLSIRCAKALVCSERGEQVIDHARLLVRDGLIEQIGRAAQLGTPDGYVELDLGDCWVMPGMIDLHSHIGGSFDINDAVFQANPELRVSTAVQPGNANLRRALASGVTTVLFIPGSATTVGGQGILLKTGAPTYDSMVLREAGSLKIAQADNPVRWGYGMGRIMLNWQIREVCRRGLAYAAKVEDWEQGRGPRPPVDLMFEPYIELAAKHTQISTHTQVYQVVLATIRILKQELDFDVYIDHGEFDAYELGPLAEQEGVAGIIGPRSISTYLPSRGCDHDGRLQGLAAGWQEFGLSRIGFNTDAPVIPAEELFLQASMAVKFGLDYERLETVRGLTIVPALTAGIAQRVGSLEPGKDADLVVVTGDPVDPREHVELVMIEGHRVYDKSAGQVF